MNRFFLIFYILGLLGCSVVLAEESIFRVRLVEDLGTLDWGYGEVNAQVVDQLMEGLTFVDRRGNATPAVARKWVSTGNITQFFLRSDAKWSDGRRVCAEDFEIAWQRIREAQIVSPYSHLFKDIQAVRAKSCEKLEVETKTPLSYLPELLSHWVFYPVQKNSYQKQRDKFFEPENLISNGPYKIKKWHKDSRYVLEKNEYYFAEKARPLLLEFLVVSDDQTALTLYKAGKIDWLKDPPILSRDQIVRSEGFRV
ncbi:MAG TPA: ABC transporter substrate-binding protein, partial [Oligoflexia bacterium]|nr:ABC transporter substrate-binding protein [Oligoflexia bacterium]